MATREEMGNGNGGSDDGQLCWHIRPFASAWTDGTLSALTHWFVDKHVSRCRSCQKALAALKSLTKRLHALRAVPPTESLQADRWVALESAWADIDRRRDNHDSKQGMT